jgi:hypothetical protein
VLEDGLPAVPDQLRRRVRLAGLGILFWRFCVSCRLRLALCVGVLAIL